MANGGLDTRTQGIVRILDPKDDLSLLWIDLEDFRGLVDAYAVPLAKIEVDTKTIRAGVSILSRSRLQTGIRRYNLLATSVAHATWLLELDDHFRMIVPVAVRGLSELEFELSQKVTEDRLQLHHCEGRSDTSMTSGAEGNPSK